MLNNFASGLDDALQPVVPPKECFPVLGLTRVVIVVAACNARIYVIKACVKNVGRRAHLGNLSDRDRTNIMHSKGNTHSLG